MCLHSCHIDLCHELLSHGKVTCYSNVVTWDITVAHFTDVSLWHVTARPHCDSVSVLPGINEVLRCADCLWRACDCHLPVRAAFFNIGNLDHGSWELPVATKNDTETLRPDSNRTHTVTCLHNYWRPQHKLLISIDQTYQNSGKLDGLNLYKIVWAKSQILSCQKSDYMCILKYYKYLKKTYFWWSENT